ncbi:hypothetical protein [Agrobacterium sp. SORGH_AS 787]|uniref:hypothetical protein n=1 Tax=Agrobacterium sp. SORGH_AS 787 TaxID=3041775 RepID=UPI002782CC21|nr:hypothetical protein [Rhizobium sp. SORGH_AS_0787]
MFKSRFILLAAVLFGMLAHATAGLAEDNADLDRSPVGYKGLEVWLQSWGIEVTRENSSTASPASRVSLRIVPLSWPEAGQMIGDSGDNDDIKSAYLWRQTENHSDANRPTEMACRSFKRWYCG